MTASMFLKKNMYFNDSISQKKKKSLYFNDCLYFSRKSRDLESFKLQMLCCAQ